MTDLKGRMFISYRRSPVRATGDAEAAMIREALRDRGIPTWRDLDDLGPGPTEDELVEILKDGEIAGAVMLVSPEVETSNMMRVVEAPAILDRFQAGDGFLLKVVLINLTYDAVDRVLDRPGVFQELNRFDIDRIAKGTLEAEDARRIAKGVLKFRIAAVRRNAPDEEVAVGLYSRRSPGTWGYVLRHDLTPYFEGRETTTEAYEKIEAALYDTATALAATGGTIPVVARGNAALPLGVLFGAVYSPFVFDLVWRQAAPGAPEADWSLKNGIEDVGVSIRSTRGDLASEDVVLAVSINADVDHAAAEYLTAARLSPRVTVSVGLKQGPLKRGETLSPQQGLNISLEAIEAIRRQKTELRMRRANLHLFLACPLSLAVLIGQNLNTFGTCTVYEHFSEKTPSYAPVHCFKPSNFTYKNENDS